jgi:hypothetical protein
MHPDHPMVQAKPATEASEEPMTDKARELASLTDDEIVAAAARFGHLGINVDDIEDDGPVPSLCMALGLFADGQTWTDRADIESQLLDRMRGMDGRIIEPGGEFGAIIMIDPREWGRILAHQPAGVIAAILAGESPPDDALTLEEIERAAFGL